MEPVDVFRGDVVYAADEVATVERREGRGGDVKMGNGGTIIARTMMLEKRATKGWDKRDGLGTRKL